MSAGDQALVIELGNTIDPDINRRVHNLLRAIEDRALPGVMDLVPTYRSLMVQYDPLQTSYKALETDLAAIEKGLDESPAVPPRLVHIPTFYAGEYAPDIDAVARHTGLSTQQVVSTHSGTDYLVYMMGFTPGFPYLGGLSESLVTPRLDTPRAEIPAGSVGIAEAQTGVYPVASPGGWHIIGRTPIKLFDPQADNSSLLVAGDYVRFVPLPGEDEYIRIRDQLESGEYAVTVETVQ